MALCSAPSTMVRRARDLTDRAGLGGVPATVVNGEYRVGASQAGSYKRLIEITDHLAKKVKTGEAY